MDIEMFLKRARKSISNFCSQECKSYCCRKGYLVLEDNQVDLVTQRRKAELESTKTLSKLENGKYSLFIGNYNLPCPSLTDFKCTIHRKKNRPLVCREFPIMLKNNAVFVSTRCLAVKEGLLYPYIHRLIKLGYKVYESDSFYDSDFPNIIYPNKEETLPSS